MIMRRPLTMPQKVGSLCLTKYLGDVSWGFLYKGFQGNNKVWIVEFYPISGGYFREMNGSLNARYNLEKDILKKIKDGPIKHSRRTNFLEIKQKVEGNQTVYFVYHQSKTFFINKLLLEKRSLLSTVLINIFVYLQLEEIVENLAEEKNHLYIWFAPAAVFIHENEKVLLLETPFMSNEEFMKEASVPETIYLSHKLHQRKVKSVCLSDCLYSLHFFLFEMLAGQPISTNEKMYQHLFEKNIDSLLQKYKSDELKKIAEITFSLTI